MFRGHDCYLMAKILLVEDNATAAALAEAWLTGERHVVELATDGEEALDMMLSIDYDIILLDWDLPLMQGIDVLASFRGQGKMTPVIMLTAKSAVEQKATGLDGGADDYLTKPFEMTELAARIRTQLRRVAREPDNRLRKRDLILDPEKMAVLQNGQSIDLQPREFSLLEFFLRNPDKVFTPQALMTRVWKAESDATTDALRSSLKRLRSKIDRPEHKTPLIETVAGAGYRFNGTEG